MSETSSADAPNPACKKCGGPVIVVLNRAWCVGRYSEGGCGGYWERKGGRWVVPGWAR